MFDAKLLFVFENEIYAVDKTVAAFFYVQLFYKAVYEHGTCKIYATEIFGIRIFAKDSAADIPNKEIFVINIQRKSFAGKIKRYYGISGIETKGGFGIF